ncbi:uncharacterized protein LOC135688246 [Rhopilema esculentum]|uniref:uncharacterized protein LOC135688246 n=2 Tax=Rhopilema esculentum TaxID=499914 RepID=UPI0031E1C990
MPSQINFPVLLSIAVTVLSTFAASYWLPQQDTLEDADDFCSTGPPGNYCQKGLVGYYDCLINPTTGTYNNKTYECKEGTRCACFDGPACPESLENPCQPFEVPPKFPTSYLMTYTGEKQTCNPMGCVTTTFSGIRYQDTKANGRFREDILGSDGIDTTMLIFSGVAQYEINWITRTCEKLTPLPLGPFQIPLYYSYDGTETVNGVEADRWHWFQGFHNQGEGYDAIYIYATHTFNGNYVPVKLFHVTNAGPIMKEATWSNETTGEFKHKTFNDTQFRIPSFCFT